MIEAELHEMMRDPRYWRDRDPEFIRRVTDGFRHLFADIAGDEAPDPAAEIAALRARVAELKASRARLAAFVRAALQFYADEWRGNMTGGGEHHNTYCFQEPTEALMQDAGQRARDALGRRLVERGGRDS